MSRTLTLFEEEGWSSYEEYGWVKVFTDEVGNFYALEYNYSVMAYDNSEPEDDEAWLVTPDEALELLLEYYEAGEEYSEMMSGGF